VARAAAAAPWAAPALPIRAIATAMTMFPAGRTARDRRTT